MDTKLIVSASPHLRSEETTAGLMANVIGGLCNHLWCACPAGHCSVRCGMCGL